MPQATENAVVDPTIPLSLTTAYLIAMQREIVSIDRDADDDAPLPAVIRPDVEAMLQSANEQEPRPVAQGPATGAPAADTSAGTASDAPATVRHDSEIPSGRSDMVPCMDAGAAEQPIVADRLRVMLAELAALCPQEGSAAVVSGDTPLCNQAAPGGSEAMGRSNETDIVMPQIEAEKKDGLECDGMIPEVDKLIAKFRPFFRVTAGKLPGARKFSTFR
jgi:hypothetical protein